VKLVLYYEAFYDEDLKARVLEELAETQPLTGRRSVALRYELFDEFFAFQDTGQVQFTLRPTMLPFHHTNPVIRQLTVLIQTDDGVSPAGLNVYAAAADGASADQATDADGALSTGGGAPFDAFVGRPLLQGWTVALPRAANQGRFDAGFQWAQVANIVLVAEYEFTPRLTRGEPRLLLRDGFDQDPLAAFDVIDDPQANQGAPSAWAYNAAGGWVEQTSDIRGGPDGPADTGPAKPGTYLVRKTGAALPAVKDFVLSCRARSEEEDGIGAVLRWQDADNFYFFLMDRRRGYRRLGKKVGGVFQELAAPAVDTGAGYVSGHDYLLKVRARGPSLEAYLDGNLVLSGQDASLADAGRVGFFCWGNSAARFDDLHVVAL
jgi:hypothetical protein